MPMSIQLELVELKTRWRSVHYDAGSLFVIYVSWGSLLSLVQSFCRVIYLFLGSLTWDFLGRIYGLLVSGHLERSLDGAAVF